MPAVKKIRHHYDLLSVFYHLLWGEHIHHGCWTGDESPRRAQLNLIGMLSRRADLCSGGKVLDIGCGVGGSSLWLAEQYGCEVTGLTVSPVQARLAEFKRRRRHVTHVVFRVHDANDLSGLEPGYDCVWIIECSEHITDKAAFFRHCCRLLTPGGRLALCSWLKGGRENAALLEEICGAMLCPMLPTGDELVRCIGDAGFSSIRFETITDRVKRTWQECIRIAHKRTVRLMLPLMGGPTKRFVNSFELMLQAYDTGVMEYGMITAEKPRSPSPL